MAFLINKNEEKLFILMLIGISIAAPTNFDCNGRSFRCVNSTHFMICVDLGGGVSTTVDDLAIPCPPSTACKPTNRFECEFEAPTTLPPTKRTTELTTTFLPLKELSIVTLAPAENILITGNDNNGTVNQTIYSNEVITVITTKDNPDIDITNINNIQDVTRITNTSAVSITNTTTLDNLVIDAADLNTFLQSETITKKGIEEQDIDEIINNIENVTSAGTDVITTLGEVNVNTEPFEYTTKYFVDLKETNLISANIPIDEILPTIGDFKATISDISTTTDNISNATESSSNDTSDKSEINITTDAPTTTTQLTTATTHKQNKSKTSIAQFDKTLFTTLPNIISTTESEKAYTTSQLLSMDSLNETAVLPDIPESNDNLDEAVTFITLPFSTPTTVEILGTEDFLNKDPMANIQTATSLTSNVKVDTETAVPYNSKTTVKTDFELTTSIAKPLENKTDSAVEMSTDNLYLSTTSVPDSKTEILEETTILDTYYTVSPSTNRLGFSTSKTDFTKINQIGEYSTESNKNTEAYEHSTILPAIPESNDNLDKVVTFITLPSSTPTTAEIFGTEDFLNKDPMANIQTVTSPASNVKANTETAVSSNSQTTVKTDFELTTSIDKPLENKTGSAIEMSTDNLYLSTTSVPDSKTEILEETTILDTYYTASPSTNKLGFSTSKTDFTKINQIGEYSTESNKNTGPYEHSTILPAIPESNDNLDKVVTFITLPSSTPTTAEIFGTEDFLNNDPMANIQSVTSPVSNVKANTETAVPYNSQPTVKTDFELTTSIDKPLENKTGSAVEMSTDNLYLSTTSVPDSKTEILEETTILDTYYTVSPSTNRLGFSTSKTDFTKINQIGEYSTESNKNTEAYEHSTILPAIPESNDNLDKVVTFITLPSSTPTTAEIFGTEDFLNNDPMANIQSVTSPVSNVKANTETAVPYNSQPTVKTDFELTTSIDKPLENKTGSAVEMSTDNLYLSTTSVPDSKTEILEETTILDTYYTVSPSTNRLGFSTSKTDFTKINQIGEYSTESNKNTKTFEYLTGTERSDITTTSFQTLFSLENPAESATKILEIPTANTNFIATKDTQESQSTEKNIKVTSQSNTATTEYSNFDNTEINTSLRLPNVTSSFVKEIDLKHTTPTTSENDSTINHLTASSKSQDNSSAVNDRVTISTTESTTRKSSETVNNIDNVGDSKGSQNNLTTESTIQFSIQTNTQNNSLKKETTSTTIWPREIVTKSIQHSDTISTHELLQTVNTQKPSNNATDALSMNDALTTIDSQFDGANSLTIPCTAVTQKTDIEESELASKSSTYFVATTEKIQPTKITENYVSSNPVYNPSFECQGQRGKYGDNNDCTKFYICVGHIEPVVGYCPNNTVFSENISQCTKNLSHCIRNNQFRCTSPGRFVDLNKDNIYYICVGKPKGYLRFKLQCQNGYHLNKTLVKCIENLKELSIQSSSASSSSVISSLSKSSTDSVRKSVPENKYSSNEDNKNDKTGFECEEEGKFPDPFDCRRYYVCILKSSKYRRRIKKCDDDEMFHKNKKKCVSAESQEC